MDNKEKILETALDLFYAKGYDAVGVQEIAEKSGVTKPTLYHYYGSKYGLLESLIKTYYEDFEKDVRWAELGGDDLPTTLYRVVKTFFELAHKKPKFYSFFMSMLYAGEASDMKKAVLPYASRQMNAITQLFTQANPVIGNMNGRQEQYAVTLIGMVNHYLLMYLTRGDESVFAWHICVAQKSYELRSNVTARIHQGVAEFILALLSKITKQI